MSAQFHLAKNALPLHLFLERLEGLINVIVANENLHAGVPGRGASHRMIDCKRRDTTTPALAKHLNGDAMPITDPTPAVQGRDAPS